MLFSGANLRAIYLFHRLQNDIEFGRDPEMEGRDWREDLSWSKRGVPAHA